MPRPYQSLPDFGWRFDAFTKPDFAGSGVFPSSLRTAGMLPGCGSGSASGAASGSESPSACSAFFFFFNSQTVFSTFVSVTCWKPTDVDSSAVVLVSTFVSTCLPTFRATWFATLRKTTATRLGSSFASGLEEADSDSDPEMEAVIVAGVGDVEP